MRKVIVISTVGLIYDGITNVITSYLEAMNRNNLEFYVISTIKSEPKIEKRLKDLGCHIVRLPSRRQDTIHYLWALQSFIRKNKIEVMHAHGNSATLSIEFVAGFLGGCRKRIAHSHNTKCNQVKADRVLRPIFNLLYTDALACGIDAGQWLFKNRKFQVLRNGRNVEKYAFSREKREQMRKQYSIINEMVIGHVGGFFEQKNHRFLIKVFRKVLEIQPDAKMFLIGDGPLKLEIESSVEDIKSHVIFTGTVDNVSDFLQAMDGMLLPSLFEGLPLVAIEWQINGLPSLLSDTITNDCKITDNVKFDSIEADPEIWAHDILNMINKRNRVNNSLLAIKLAQNKGFDIKDNVEILRNIYLS